MKFHIIRKEINIFSILKIKRLEEKILHFGELVLEIMKD